MGAIPLVASLFVGAVGWLRWFWLDATFSKFSAHPVFLGLGSVQGACLSDSCFRLSAPAFWRTLILVLLFWLTCGMTFGAQAAGKT